MERAEFRFNNLMVFEEAEGVGADVGVAGYRESEGLDAVVWGLRRVSVRRDIEAA